MTKKLAIACALFSVAYLAAVISAHADEKREPKVEKPFHVICYESKTVHTEVDASEIYFDAWTAKESDTSGDLIADQTHLHGSCMVTLNKR